MTTTLYGISNCDTVKKARAWLQEQGIEYQFHDFRKDGLNQQLLTQWLKTTDWETLLNKRGTTWRQLPDADKAAPTAESVLTLFLDHPTLIKRPVLATNDQLLIGFKPDQYQKAFPSG